MASTPTGTSINELHMLDEQEQARFEARQRTAAHYSQQAALANLPAAVEELQAARQMLLKAGVPLHMIFFRVTEALRLLQAPAPREDRDLVLESYGAGHAWLRP